ncbi:MAG: hypothetical protein HC836_34770 [Richelia sp. RM2_1_2]|nr:hypothetical protein [Richelia sp. RM2_1_2]
MAEFYKGERVIVQRGEYKNQHGKINSEMLVDVLENKYQVSLDNGNNSEFYKSNLKHEDLSRDEISTVIKNIAKEVNQVSSKLPEEMKTELPNHIGYLKDALLSEDKSRAEIEYNYVTSNLKKLSEQQVLSPDWTESTRIYFDKMNYAVKRLS